METAEHAACSAAHRDLVTLDRAPRPSVLAAQCVCVQQELIDFLLPQRPDPNTAAVEAHHDRRKDVAYSPLDTAERDDYIQVLTRTARRSLDQNIVVGDMQPLLFGQSLEGTLNFGCSRIDGFHFGTCLFLHDVSTVPGADAIHYRSNPESTLGEPPTLLLACFL
jgi:hypothetical protein